MVIGAKIRDVIDVDGSAAAEENDRDTSSWETNSNVIQQRVHKEFLIIKTIFDSVSPIRVRIVA